MIKENKGNPEDIKERCVFCNRLFNFGMHKYYGKYIKKYDLSVCDNCLNANWDGLQPSLGKKLEKHLKDKELDYPPKTQAAFTL